MDRCEQEAQDRILALEGLPSPRSGVGKRDVLGGEVSVGWRRCVRSSAGGDPGVDLGLFPHPVLVGVAKPFEVGGAWGVLQKGCKAPEVAKLLIGAVELGGVVLQLLGMRMQAVQPG